MPRRLQPPPSDQPRPYAEGSEVYDGSSIGWAIPMAKPAPAKFPPVSGFTGATGAIPDPETISEWMETHARHNLGLRLPRTVIGLDVDAYEGKAGGQTLAALEEALGPLPPTWTSTSRGDLVSGIRLYTLPGDVSANLHDPGDGIEVIRWGHRYVLAWPSIHPTGGLYRWTHPDLPRGDGNLVPAWEDLAPLPQPWLDYLSQQSTPDRQSTPKRHTDDIWTGRDVGTGGGSSPGDRLNHETDLAGAVAMVEAVGYHSPSRVLSKVIEGEEVSQVLLTRPGKDGRQGHSMAVIQWPDGGVRFHFYSPEDLPEAMDTRPEGFDPFGFWARWHHGGDFEAAAQDVLERHPEWVPSKEEAIQEAVEAPWDPPEPLVDHPEPFPLEAIPEPLRSYVREVSQTMVVPVEYAILPALTCLSAAVAGGLLVDTGQPAWRERVVLWTLVVGHSSALKTPTLNEVMAPLEEVLDDKARASRVARENARAKLKRAEKAQAAAQQAYNQAETEADLKRTWSLLEAANQALVDAQEDQVPDPDFILTDTTTEAAVTAMAQHGGVVAIFSSEGQTIHSITGAYSSGNANAKDLNQAYEGSRIRRERQKGGSTRVRNAIAPISLLVQPSVLGSLLSKEALMSEGTTPRFILSWPPRPDLSVSPTSGIMLPALRTQWGKILGQIFDRFWGNVATPISMTLEEPLLWKDLAQAMRRAASQAMGSAEESWGGKSTGRTLRLAALLELVQDPYASTIQTSTLRSALRVVDWAWGEFDRLTSGSTQGHERDVLEWLLKRASQGKLGDNVTTREVHAGLQSRSWVRRADDVSMAMAGLERGGLVRLVQYRTGRGRPSEVWAVRPDLTEVGPGLLDPDFIVDIVDSTQQPAEHSEWSGRGFLSILSLSPLKVSSLSSFLYGERATPKGDPIKNDKNPDLVDAAREALEETTEEAVQDPTVQEALSPFRQAQKEAQEDRAKLTDSLLAKKEAETCPECSAPLMPSVDGVPFCPECSDA